MLLFEIPEKEKKKNTTLRGIIRRLKDRHHESGFEGESNFTYNSYTEYIGQIRVAASVNTVHSLQCGVLIRKKN